MSHDTDYQPDTDSGDASTEHSVDASSKQSMSSKRKRGPSVMDRVNKVRATGVRIEVELNNELVPIDKNGGYMMTYLGILTRLTVPITFKRWAEVPKHLKDKIWDTLQMTFIIPDTKEFRKMMMKSAADKLKQFKTRMGRDYIWPYHGVDNELMYKPPPKYKFITQEMWNEFVTHRLSDEFKEIREKCIEQAKKTKFRHRTSRKGYASLEKELQKQKGTTEKIPRHELWKEARKNKKGEFKKPEEAEIAKKIDELVRDQSSSSFQPSAKQDILTEALGTPEHGGRLRAASSLATPSSYWGTKKSISQEQYNKMEHELSTVKNVLQGLLQWQQKFTEFHPGLPSADFTSMLAELGVNISASTSINLPLTPEASKSHAKHPDLVAPQAAHPAPQREEPGSVEGSRKKIKTKHQQMQEDTDLSLGWVEGFSVVDEFMVI